MSTNRRDFLGHVAATTVLGVLPLSALGNPALAEFAAPPANPDEFDLTWTARLKGKKHVACFDCAEVESGYGVWRASIWEGQQQSALAAKAADIATVVVLRHAAINLAFQQDYWAANKIGSVVKVTHPITQQGTESNPVLLTSKNSDLPAMFDAFALPNLISRGAVVLACNVALQFHAQGVAAAKGISAEEAYKQAKAAFVPGVILQPSGVFAAVHAQTAGAKYVRAS